MNQLAEDLLTTFGDSRSIESLVSQSQSDINVVTTDNAIAAVLQDYDRRVSRTTSKKEFDLKDADIEHLTYTTAVNPHYRSGPRMRLYLLRDCIQVAVQKHGSFDEVRQALRDKTLKSEARKQKRDENEQRRFSARRQELLDAFEPRHLQIRDDSRLCEEYLSRKKGDIGTARSIARIMDEMRFYKNHTNYDEYWSECRHRCIRRKGYFDRDEISQEAKDLALQDFVQTHMDTMESMILHEEFPPSLEATVRSLMQRI
jgi:hypothetical protein